MIGLLGFSSCSISLSGVQVPIDVNTFSVDYFNFSKSVRLVVPTLSQEVTDQITQKILRETRLKLDKEKPNIEFTGEITVYEVGSEAPTSGQSVSLNRLDIAVKVDFTNHLDEDANWTSSFSNFSNFDPNESLATVQDELIEVILKDIVEDIYQKAFTNW